MSPTISARFWPRYGARMRKPVRRARRGLRYGLAAVIAGWSVAAAADPVEIDALFQRPGGAPLAGLELRLVVGSEPSPRSAEAGRRLRTDPSGRIVQRIEAPVKTRRVTLDNIFAWHRSHFVEVGIELELVGRKALYWIELDMLREGAMAGMTAYVQDADGRFTRPLKFHGATHSWSFPDQPDGMLMSDIGASLVQHDMTGDAGGPWKIDLVVEKQEFTVR